MNQKDLTQSILEITTKHNAESKRTVTISKKFPYERKGELFYFMSWNSDKESKGIEDTTNQIDIQYNIKQEKGRVNRNYNLKIDEILLELQRTLENIN